MFEDCFRCNKNKKPIDITEEQIITRMVVVDAIDSTNISKSFGTGCFTCIAKTIKETNLEVLIAGNKPISNEIFKKIALRNSINGKRQLSLFSFVTKYIARTAQYAYGIRNGYPIYDGVLCNNLHRYIESCKPNYLRSLAKIGNYEEYCQKINGFLKDYSKRNNEQIDNILFDSFVWYTYKKRSADQKFK